MSEIRYCKLRDTDVIISAKRLHRPTQFDTPKDYYTLEECPFEVEAEDATPSELFSIKDENGDWITRVVPNLYNALDIDELKNSSRDGFFTSRSSFGAHEVIIETPDHDKTMDQYSLENWSAYLNTINHRVNDLSGDKRLEHIQVFKNHGGKAGASLRHPHSQILATGFVPSELKAESKRLQKYYEIYGRTLLEDLVSEELRVAKRIVYENNSFVAYTPYASLYPFELFIAPKIHMSCMSEIDDLSKVLQNVYKKLYGVLGDFHFNMIFKNSLQKNDFYTFHIQIIPRIYMLAGYELGTGMRINPLEPELACKKLKGVL